jgi:hypothetical protein
MDKVKVKQWLANVLQYEDLGLGGIRSINDAMREIDNAAANIEALEAENAALRAMNADVDVGINNWIDHIEKHGASGAAIQSMRNLLERSKR